MESSEKKDGEKTMQENDEKGLIEKLHEFLSEKLGKKKKVTCSSDTGNDDEKMEDSEEESESKKKIKSLEDKVRVLSEANESFEKAIKSQPVPAITEEVQKKLDELEELKKSQHEAIAKAETLELEKRVNTEFFNLSGTVESKVELLKVLKSLPEEQRNIVEATLKSANAIVGSQMTEVGVSGYTENCSNKEKFEKQLAKFAKERNISDNSTAITEFVKTPEGAMLSHKANSESKG